MLMVIEKEIEGPAEPKARGGHGPSETQSRTPASDDALSMAAIDAHEEEDRRSLAFVYVIIASLIGLGIVSWAISAIF
jgi:hypothetical protein